MAGRPGGGLPGERELPVLEPTQALWRGIVTALVIVVPAGVLNQLLIDSGDLSATSPLTFVFWLLILLGGAAGGWAVIRLSPDASLLLAAGAAAAAYLIIQAVGVARRLVAGDDISWIAYPFLALMMAVFGMFGGRFGRRWNRTVGDGRATGDSRAAPGNDPGGT